jgi:type VI secretion system protein ImpM
MSAGLFGKLPAKRDFIAARAPRPFLAVWEPWLQAGMATSKQMLGTDWNDAFNRAPIWRFWLGEGICGQATLGAFMASVDGVGRSFPLTIFFGDGEGSIPPPEIETNDAWFDAAETILLNALEPMSTFDEVAAAAEAMAPPVRTPSTSSEVHVEFLPENAVLARSAAGCGPRTFAALRESGYRRVYAAQSFWWTVGGEDYSPLALAVVGLPSAPRFTDMLTGAFGANLDGAEGGSRDG